MSFELIMWIYVGILLSVALLIALFCLALHITDDCDYILSKSDAIVYCDQAIICDNNNAFEYALHDTHAFCSSPSLGHMKKLEWLNLFTAHLHECYRQEVGRNDCTAGENEDSSVCGKSSSSRNLMQNSDTRNLQFNANSFHVINQSDDATQKQKLSDNTISKNSFSSIYHKSIQRDSSKDNFASIFTYESIHLNTAVTFSDSVRRYSADYSNQYV